MITAHEVQDIEHAEAIAKSMRENGWVGGPLVTNESGDELITGTHRHYAWTEILGRDESDIPTVAIDELCEEYGISWADLCEEFIWADDPGYEATKSLPTEMRRDYGIDTE
jgi:hypothetical protein